MNNVRKLREEKGLRQDDLARALYLATSAISAIENDKRMMTEDVILRLCAFFGVSADYLLGRSGIRKPVPEITEEELALIDAYRRADARCRAIVELALLSPSADNEPPEPLRSKKL